MAITVINNVPNTSYEVNGKKLTLTANDGYKFEYAPTYFVSVFDNGDMSVSTDGKTATVTLMSTNASVTLDGSVVADVVPPPQPTDDLKITNNIEHTTFEVNNNVVTLTADNGYKFDVAPTWFISVFANGDFNLSADGKTATADFSSNPNATVSFDGSVVADIVPPPQPTDDYKIKNEIAHTTFEVSGTTLTVTADTGYKFETAPTANNYAAPHVTLYDRTATTATISDDGKTAVFDLSTSETGVAFPKQYEITLNGTVVVDSEQTDFFGSINVYVVTNKNLRQFAEMRFLQSGLDMGDYVVKLFRLFAPVGETKDSVLTCGNYNTNINCQSPINELQVLDFGTVELPRHNDSASDYNSSIEIFLPFIGFVKIDNTYLGKTVALTYDVNVVTGEAVAKLSCDGVLFAVHDCNSSTDILYKTVQDNIIGSVKFNSNFLYGLEPFVKVVWYESQNNFINNSDCQRVRIGDVTGFARITEVNDLQSEQMTADERLLIMNQLNIGIYVEQS